MGKFELDLRLRPLCACLSGAMALGTCAASAVAAEISTSALSLALAHAQGGAASAILGSTVTNCDDTPYFDLFSGASLRYLVAHANPGETIDVSNCSSITLSLGGILTPQFVPLTISGNGSSTIYASATEPAFGSLSNLTLANLTISGGVAVAGLDGIKKGGSMYAVYNLTLQNSTISGGVAKGVGSKGGSIYALGNVTLQNSTVTGGHAVNAGGCIYTKGSVILEHSTVSGCAAYALGYVNANITAMGGAIAAGSVTLKDASSVMSSRATGSAICFYYGCHVGPHYDQGGGISTSTLTCSDSRITGNGARSGAGIAAQTASLTRCTIDNNFLINVDVRHYASGLSVSGSAEVIESTISNNGAGIDGNGSVTLTASTVVENGYIGISGTSLSAYSSIVALNGLNLQPPFGPFDVVGMLSGADNLVMKTSVTQAPGVVAVTADPMLLPLGYNGGQTPTRALDAASPAVNKGSNAGHSATDQRGDGFVRAFGRPDIGAFEWQVEGDEVFYGGFD